MDLLMIGSISSLPQKTKYSLVVIFWRVVVYQGFSFYPSSFIKYYNPGKQYYNPSKFKRASYNHPDSHLHFPMQTICSWTSLIIIQKMELKPQQLKSSNKINYRQKNLDYIEKLKQKKQRQLEQKILQERKQHHRRETLKKKILEQATKTRENKLKEIKDLDNNIDELKSRNSRPFTNFESLPKIPSQKQKEGEESAAQKKNYEQRYLVFLQSLHQTNKSKRQNQELQRKKKEERVSKFKEDLGYNHVESKLNFARTKKQKSEVASESNDGEELVRSHSAEKFESLIEIAENELPKTNKNFKRKNEEYIEKIKKKREDEEKVKEQERLKKEKLKEKLKDYVMTTVKKNVLDGVYDDEFDKKAKRTAKEGQEEQNQQDEESEEQQKDSVKKKVRKMRSYPHVTDLDQWKKKNRLQNGERVFIVTGGYPEFKKALRERSWVQNPDVHSPCFELKFTLQGRQLDFKNLLDFQMVNHFEKNGVITTKLGLSKTLRNSVWINDVSEDSFFPKCFDLNDEDEYFAFEMHFKVCKALSILKIYAHSTKSRKDEKVKQDKALLQDLKMRTEVAVSVCLKNIEDLDDIIDKKKYPKIITDKQWEILASDELNQESLAKKKHEEWLKSIDCKFGSVGVTKKPQKEKKKKKKEKAPGDKPENQVVQNQPEQQQSDELLEKVQEVLEQYRKRFPHQYHLTQHNNIWILKPAGLSRGRGITCYNNFVQIQDHVRCKESLWIAQKYIENPLVILKRKFDIRQWVLVTDFNPLIIWMYDQCYVRFSAIDYDPKQVSNKFIHLTNNSIGAYYKDFDKSAIKGNMFFQDQMRNYLNEKQGYDVFEDKIKPQMKEIIKQSMLCALDGIQNRKNTHELFGYDFMIDENYKVWLIEINSSPSMDYSTHVTTKLVKEVLHDLAKVIIDHASAPKKEKKHVDTGKFRRIYKGVEVNEKIASAGLNLCLEGIPMKKGKRPTVKPQNMSLDTK